MKVRSKISADGKFKVELLNCREPNNGRMLWQVDLTYLGKNINNLIFSDNWNFINHNIGNWELNNKEESFYYIPTEGRSTLVRCFDFDVIKLPIQKASTIRFFGNKFINNCLIEIYQDAIVITRLDNYVSKVEIMEMRGIIESTKIIKNKAISVRKKIFGATSQKIIDYEFKI